MRGPHPATKSSPHSLHWMAQDRAWGRGLPSRQPGGFRITGPVKTLILALSGHSVKFIALILPRNQHYLVAVLPKASCSALLPPNSSNFLINTPSHLWSWSRSIPGLKALSPEQREYRVFIDRKSVV